MEPGSKTAAGIEWRPALLLGLLAMATFSLSLLNDFVYDDHFYVKGNRWIRDWANLPAFFLDPGTKAEGVAAAADFWRPLRNVSYLIDYQIAGLRPAWFHLTNLLLHGIATAGLFAVLRRAGGSMFLACAAAAFFAVHPAQTESVAWIKERDGVLSGAFLMWALFLALGGRGARVEAMVLLAAALLSKESAVVYTPLLAGLCWVRGDFRKRDGIVLCGAAALTGGFLLLRHAMLGGTAQTSLPPGGTWGTTVYTMGEVFLRYLGHVFAPFALEIDYSWMEPAAGFAPLAVAGWVAVLALLVAMIIGGRGNRWVALGIGWFLVALIPYSNLVPMTQWMAVRFLYLSLAGAGIALAALAESCLAGRRLPYRDLPTERTLAAVLVALLAFLSTQETLLWRNDLTLWSRAYERRPGDPRTMAFVAEHLNRFGDSEAALDVLDAFPFGSGNEHDELATKARIDALLAVERDTEALALARGETPRFPQSARLYLLLGFLEVRAGNRDAAMAAWEQALAIAPNNVNVIDNLAGLYEGAGRRAEAEELRGRREAPGK